MEAALSKIIVQILLTEPFFGHLAAKLLRESREDQEETALILQADGKITLGVNPHFWNNPELTEKQQVGAIKHELLHLALMHPFRQADFTNLPIFNIAADLVVNQYLKKEQLRENQISLEKLPSVNWKRNRGIGYYYRRLESVLQKSGNASKDDLATLSKWLEPEHPAGSSHQQWADGLDRLLPEQKEAIGAFWQHRLRELMEEEGSFSFYRLEETLRELIRKSLSVRSTNLDWRRVLKMFASNSRKMVLKDTIRRPSKRYGTVPGLKIKRRQKLIVALDTSGSLKAQMLSDFFREIYQLWRAGSELTIVECDDQIRRQYPYHGQSVVDVSGRGATLFDAPIRLANESRIDGLIYLTDGFGPVPEVSPRLPMLWMISKDGLRPDSRTWRSLPGKVVRMG